MTNGQMQFLGEVDGLKWYWAAPGEFLEPGAYYWDGNNNVRAISYKCVQTEMNRADLLAEDIECLHKNFDGAGIPRADASGNVYSMWGRAQLHAAALTREHDEARRELAEVRGKALEEAAKVCESFIAGGVLSRGNSFYDGRDQGAGDCADSIRALATSSKGGGA